MASLRIERIKGRKGEALRVILQFLGGDIYGGMVDLLELNYKRELKNLSLKILEINANFLLGK